jgi:hypothetical protein
MNDNLEKLEKKILEYYLSKGYRLQEHQSDGNFSWSFEISIDTKYKDKKIRVYFIENETFNICFSGNYKTIKELFESSLNRFTVPFQMPCPYGSDNYG